MTVVIGGVQVSVTRVQRSPKVERSDWWQSLDRRLDERRNEALRISNGEVFTNYIR